MASYGKIILLCCAWTLPCFGTWPDQPLTLEEKVGQLLIVHFRGEQANEDAKTLIQDTKVGGIIYYEWANSLRSPEQVQQLSCGLQKLAQENRIPVPLFIATDQEGGIVARLTRGFTIFPGNRALTETNNPDLAESAARAMGEELRAVGINLNFAPVVDVNVNPKNPIIGIRSFGENPETVIAFGEKALRGYSSANIITTLKHYPGHGDVEIDSHKGLPIVHKTIEELERVELLPFARLSPSADLVMTAHLLVPALDPDHCSTLSSKTLDYLKNAIGFQGAIISDSLVMEGVLKQCSSVDEAAIVAFNAGCDILLLGGRQLVGGHENLELTPSDVQRIHTCLVNAVKGGRISMTRLDQSVNKILKLKERYVKASKPEEAADLNHILNTPDHRALAQKIASLALKTSHKECKELSTLHNRNVCVIAPQALEGAIRQTSLLEIGKKNKSYFLSSFNPSSDEIETTSRQAATSDVIFVCSYNAWKYPSQIACINSLLSSGKPVIIIVTRDPLDGAFFPKATLICTTFGPTVPSLQAVAKYVEEISS